MSTSDEDSRSGIHDASPSPTSPQKTIYDNYELRSRPSKVSCKSLLEDLEAVNKVIASAKSDLTSQITEKFDAVKSLLTNDETGVYVRLSNLESKCLTGPAALVPRVESLEGKLRQVSEAENVVFQTPPELETEHNRMKQWMDQATHVITVLEKQVQSNSERIFHNVAKNFSDNVKISGIPEDKGSPLVATKWFLENILEIEDVAEADILEAARLPGTMTVNIKGVRVELPRQMFVKCTPLLRQEIDRVKPILNEKKDPLDGHFYRIKPHLPDIFAAARQHYAPLIEQVISEDADLEDSKKHTFYFRGADLYINKQKVIEDIQPPSRASLLHIPPSVQNVIDDLNIPKFSEKKARGSLFEGFAARVYSLECLKKMYLRMRQQHPTANHIIMAYKIDAVSDPKKVLKGSCADGESHADVKLTAVLEKTYMSNVVVFVTRYYGGVHLGGLRLKLISDCGRLALNKLRFPDGKEPTDDPPEGTIPVLNKTPPHGLSPRSSPTSEHEDEQSASRVEHTYAKSNFTTSHGGGRGGLGCPPGQRHRFANPKKKPRREHTEIMPFTTL